MDMNYPNKIYVCEFSGDNNIMGTSHFVVIVAASDSEVAKKHVKERIGFDCEPLWLMNAVYPTIYDTFGRTPLNVQVKILSNNTFHTDFN